LRVDRIRLVFFKELLEALRDYRTVIPMVFLSLALGPLLTIVWPGIAVSQAKGIVQDTYKVAIVGQDKDLRQLVLKEREFKLIDLGSTPPQQAVDKGVVDACLVLPASFEGLLVSKIDDVPTVDILYDGAKMKSNIAKFRLSHCMDKFNQSILKKRMQSLGITLEAPPLIEARGVSPPTPFGVASTFLQAMLTCVLMMMALMGVIYPALDAVTGERERQTLEPLLMTQAERSELFAGKLLTVSTTAYVSVVLTLLGFFAGQFLQRNVLHGLTLGLEAVFPWPCFLLTAIFMLPLCITVAASALMFASFAKTIQQGQGYFLPLMMLGLLPLPVALLGDVHLNAAISVVPFLNSVVAFNDILSGYVSGLWLTVSFLVSLGFCCLIVQLASPLLAREDLLFDVQEAPERRFAAGDYRRELFFLSVVVFLLMFYLSQVLVYNYRLFGIALTQIFVVLLPGLLFVHYWLRLPLGSVLNFSKPKGGLRTIIAAALISPLTIAAASGFVYLQSKILPGAETLGKLMAKALEMGNAPLLVLILVVGVLPGICEEVLFRGVILSLLPRRFSQTKIIVIVGAIFGAFHLSLARFLPTGALGALLAFIRIRAGSLWPCMLLHCLHNSLSVVLATNMPGDPPGWMYAAAVSCGLLGLWLFMRATD